MDNNNLKENENPSGGSKIVKILKMFGTYLKNLGTDFITSFKYNNMKLPGLLVCVPGVFLGFFLVFHAPVVKGLTYQTAVTNVYYKDISFDPTAILLFCLVLFGILNIFAGVTMMGKKNLGSVVKATITSSLVVISGICYLIFLFIFVQGVNEGAINVTTSTMDMNFVMSVVSVIISIVASIAGIVLGFIFYDRTYEKVDR